MRRSSPAARQGPHQLVNRTDEPFRVLIASTKDVAEVVEYPDSGKLGVATASGRTLLRADATVTDYFEGKPPRER